MTASVRGQFKYTRVILLGCFICVGVNAPPFAQIKIIGGISSTPAPTTLTVADVIKLARAKVSDDIIIQQIKKRGHSFDLSTDQLISLKKASVHAFRKLVES
jgi:hypothetical protein